MTAALAKTLVRAIACVALASLGLLAAAPARAQAQPQPPAAELFFQEPAISGAQLSPDGRYLGMRVAAKGHRARLAVLDLQTMRPDVVASFDDKDIGQFRWVNDKRLVFTLDQEQTGPGRAEHGPGLFAVDADGDNFRQLVETYLRFVRGPETGTPLLPWRHQLLHSQVPRRDDDVFVIEPGEVSKAKVGNFVLRRLNTRTGRASEVEAPPHAVDWTLDAQGALRLVLTRQGEDLAVHWRDDADRWKTLTSFKLYGQGGWTPRFIAPDGTLWVVAGHGDKQAVFSVDPATGQRADKPLVTSPDFDVHPEFLVGRGQLLGVRHTLDGQVTQWLDADARALQATVDALLPATANRLQLPQRGDSPHVLVQAYSDVQPAITLVYHQGTRKLSRVGVSHPGIDPKRMGLTDFVRYRAADGLDIPAYITLPPGVALDGKPKNLPLVVLVHGGPWVRGTSWQWQDEVQFLATRGYAVLQPEFRGSTGFGDRHFKAGFRQWGQAMQRDLADGARWAIAQGIADPQRIAIAGASYGGYATLMGLLQNPELFRAGISWVGVTDPGLMFSVPWSDVTDEGKRHSLATLIGDPVADAEHFKTISPLAQAARIRQPLLLAHGAWDLRVPIVHGEKFRDANRPHNPLLEWVAYPEEGHGWRRLETRLDFWGRVERFLARHLAPR